MHHSHFSIHKDVVEKTEADSNHYVCIVFFPSNSNSLEVVNKAVFKNITQKAKSYRMDTSWSQVAEVQKYSLSRDRDRDRGEKRKHRT